MNNSLFEFDKKQRRDNHVTMIAGFDEAGRGPLAGPVSCAGVVLPPDYENDLINDSKKLTDKERRILFEEIKEKAIAYSVILVPVKTIDEINILEADRLGMETCLTELLKKVDVEYLITDYMKLHTTLPTLAIAKGDATSISVAAASILAKVTRDRIMEMYDRIYPQYGLARNKGYPTKAHMEAIELYGITPIHRRSFGPVKAKQMSFDF